MFKYYVDEDEDTYHQGAKLEVIYLGRTKPDSVGAYNSIRAGLPLPTTLSKLSGPSSRTFDALAPAARADKKRENEKSMCWEC